MKRIVLVSVLLFLALCGAEAGEVAGTVELKSEVQARSKNRNPNRKKTLKKYAGKDLRRARAGGQGGPSPNEKIDERNFAVFYLVSAEGKKLKATPKAVEVRQAERRFRNHVTPMALGSKVRFTNSDKFFHHIYCPDASEMNAPEHRGAVERKPKKLGKYELFCDIHPLMNAFVYVVPNDFFCTAQNGKFAIKGVPAGSYELKVWHPRLKDKSYKVKVSDSGTTKVNVTL